MKKLFTCLLTHFFVFITLIQGNESVLPPQGNLPVMVKTSFYLLHLEKIDEVTQSFGAMIYLRLSWHDDRLKFDPIKEKTDVLIFSGKSSVEEKLSEIWWPQLELENITSVDYTNHTLFIYPEGKVVLLLGLTGDFLSSLHFERYPFDTQHLEIRISSFVWDASVMQFTLDKDQQELFEESAKDFNDYHVTQVNAEVHTIQERSVTGNAEYSTLIFSINLKRNPAYAIYEFFLPILIILIVTCSVFFLERWDLADRLFLITGSILVFVGTKFTISLDLPRVSYMTILDTVFFVSYIIGSIAVVLSVIVYFLDKKNPEKAHKIDSMAWWMLPLLFLALTGLIIWMT